MSDENHSITDSLTKLPQRVGSLLELLATLDQRIMQALDSLEQMRTSVTAFEGVGDSGDELVRDVQERIAKFDERLHRDLDELRNTLREKLAEVDVKSFDARLDKLERSIENIERATVSLDRAFEGAIEVLPDFVTKRMKGEGKKEAPAPPGQMPG